MAADFNPAKAWETHQQREARGKKVADLAAQHKLHLTTSQQRSWYEDTWTETVVDWPAVADLLDKVAPGWDADGVPACIPGRARDDDAGVQGPALEELRHAVRTAWFTGTNDFRRHYDQELFQVLGIGCFQDLYQDGAPGVKGDGNA